MPTVLRLAVVLLAVAAAAPPAKPQANRGADIADPATPPTPGTRVAPTNPNTADPVPIELAPEPLVLATIGVQVHLPAGVSVQTDTLAGRSRTVVDPRDRSYILQIYNKITGDTGLTSAAALDAVVAQRREQIQRTKTRRTALRARFRSDDLSIGGFPASRVYLDVPSDPNYPVSGYTIVRPAPGRFVFFQADYPTAGDATTRSLYETIVATTRFSDPARGSEERVAQVASTGALLDRLSVEDWKGALDGSGEPRFFRIFRPATTGAASDALEVGYQRLHLRWGQAGELEPDRPRASWSATDHDFGFVAQADARYLTDGVVIDSRAVYFLSPDRETELWTVVSETRRGGQLSRAREVGIRRGERMTVKTERPGEEPLNRDFALPDAYRSAVARYLLPRLIAAHAAPGDERLDLAFYNFFQDAVTFRSESFVRSPDGWHARTQPSPDEPAWRSVYDDRGLLIQRTMADGLIVQATTRDRLSRVWRSKRLPIDE